MLGAIISETPVKMTESERTIKLFILNCMTYPSFMLMLMVVFASLLSRKGNTYARAENL